MPAEALDRRQKTAGWIAPGDGMPRANDRGGRSTGQASGFRAGPTTIAATCRHGVRYVTVVRIGSARRVR